MRAARIVEPETGLQPRRRFQESGVTNAVAVIRFPETSSLRTAWTGGKPDHHRRCRLALHACKVGHRLL